MTSNLLDCSNRFNPIDGRDHLVSRKGRSRTPTRHRAARYRAPVMCGMTVTARAQVCRIPSGSEAVAGPLRGRGDRAWREGLRSGGRLRMVAGMLRTESPGSGSLLRPCARHRIHGQVSSGSTSSPFGAGQHQSGHGTVVLGYVRRVEQPRGRSTRCRSRSAMSSSARSAWGCLHHQREDVIVEGRRDTHVVDLEEDCDRRPAEPFVAVHESLISHDRLQSSSGLQPDRRVGVIAAHGGLWPCRRRRTGG